MGRGDGGDGLVGVGTSVRSQELRRTQAVRAGKTDFGGFRGDEAFRYLKNILLQSGARPGEQTLVYLNDEEQIDAVPDLLRAAADLGLDPPHILPPPHLLSDEELAQYTPIIEEQRLGGGVLLGFPALPGGTSHASYAHDDYFTWEKAGPENRERALRTHLMNRIEDAAGRAMRDNLRRQNISIWPSKEWSRRVFPESEDPEREMAQLLLRATYTDDPEGFHNHLERLERRRSTMSDLLLQGYRHARIETPAEPGIDHPLNRGTDLRLSIARDSHFVSSQLENAQGKGMFWNNPSDEIWGTPSRSSVEGHFTSTRPYVTEDDHGNRIVIEGVYGEFRQGKLVRIEAFDPRYSYLLTRDFHQDSDPPGDVLGELGLVDSSGPLAQAKFPDGRPRTFFNTLLDENTGVHIGFGKSYANQTAGSADDAAPHEGSFHRDIVIGNERTRVSFLNDAGEERGVLENGLWQL